MIKRGNREILVDNSWVVPYNPVRSLKYNAHINIEHCNDPRAAKYLYIYVTKGSDQAAHRLFAYPVAKKFPAVYALRIHLENEQTVIFEEDDFENAMELQKQTELTAFFKYNREHPQNPGEEPLPRYVDFPKKFTWNQRKNEWQKRKIDSKTIG